jgi:hypothetical protein
MLTDKTECEISPKQIRRVVIYDYDDQSCMGLEARPFKNSTKVDVDEETTHKIFSETVRHKGWLIWKGSALGKVTVKEKGERWIIISYYGGYFKICGEKGYYEFVGSSRDVFEKIWLNIFSDHFIPNRRLRKK